MARTFVSINTRYSVDVDQTKLNAATMSPGIRYARRVQLAILREAVAKAPVGRSGEIKRSHVNAGLLRRGPWQADGTIRNVSGHAAAVHEGTTGPIFPHTAKRLAIHGAGNRIIAMSTSVRGQKANPWLAEAARSVSIRMGGVVNSIVGH